VRSYASNFFVAEHSARNPGTSDRVRFLLESAKSSWELIATSHPPALFSKFQSITGLNADVGTTSGVSQRGGELVVLARRSACNGRKRQFLSLKIAPNR